jgi:hypothetical protein
MQLREHPSILQDTLVNSVFEKITETANRLTNVEKDLQNIQVGSF